MQAWLLSSWPISLPRFFRLRTTLRRHRTQESGPGATGKAKGVTVYFAKTLPCSPHGDDGGRGVGKVNYEMDGTHTDRTAGFRHEGRAGRASRPQLINLDFPRLRSPASSAPTSLRSLVFCAVQGWGWQYGTDVACRSRNPYFSANARLPSPFSRLHPPYMILYVPCRPGRAVALFDPGTSHSSVLP